MENHDAALDEDKPGLILKSLEQAARILDDILGALDSVSRIGVSRLMLGSIFSYPRGIEEKMKYKNAAMGLRTVKELMDVVRKNQELLEDLVTGDGEFFERLLKILNADYDGMIVILLQYKGARSIGLRIKDVFEDLIYVASKIKQAPEK
ncbi:MAG: hypothetical protein ACFE7I_05645 [Candidatus Hodarchaeota archaeon]